MYAPKARANKTGINFMIFNTVFVENCLKNDAINDFLYGREPVLIQRILIGFEAILEKMYLFRIKIESVSSIWKAVRMIHGFTGTKQIIFFLLKKNKNIYKYKAEQRVR